MELRFFRSQAWNWWPGLHLQGRNNRPLPAPGPAPAPFVPFLQRLFLFFPSLLRCQTCKKVVTLAVQNRRIMKTLWPFFNGLFSLFNSFFFSQEVHRHPSAAQRPMLVQEPIKGRCRVRLRSFDLHKHFFSGWPFAPDLFPTFVGRGSSLSWSWIGFRFKLETSVWNKWHQVATS